MSGTNCRVGNERISSILLGAKSLCFSEDEYNFLRLVTVNPSLSGAVVATWRQKHQIVEPPLWNELASESCAGSTCGHFLQIMGTDSWLGHIRIAALLHGGASLGDDFFNKLQLAHDHCHTMKCPANYYSHPFRQKKYICYVFFNHVERSEFKISPDPPSGLTFRSLERSVRSSNCLPCDLECRKRAELAEASMTMGERREAFLSETETTGGNPSYWAKRTHLDKPSDEDTSQDEKPQSYWQGFHQEVTRTVVHVAREMVQEGRLDKACINSVLSYKQRGPFLDYGEALDMYIGDLGHKVLGLMENPNPEYAIISESLEAEFLQAIVQGEESVAESEGESLGNSDTSYGSDVSDNDDDEEHDLDTVTDDEEHDLDTVADDDCTRTLPCRQVTSVGSISDESMTGEDDVLEYKHVSEDDDSSVESQLKGEGSIVRSGGRFKTLTEVDYYRLVNELTSSSDDDTN